MKKQNLVLSLKMAAGVTLTAALLTVSAFAARLYKDKYVYRRSVYGCSGGRMVCDRGSERI